MQITFMGFSKSIMNLRVTPFPLADANGNAVTYVDNAGNVQAHYAYDAFGGTISQSGDMADDFPFRFSSKYLDGETGLYYYGYRYYDPSTGRWLNRDPVGERGGFLLYGFVGNNGMYRFDILGNMAYQEVCSQRLQSCLTEAPYDKKLDDTECQRQYRECMLNGGPMPPTRAVRIPTSSVTFSDSCRCVLSWEEMQEIGDNLTDFRSVLENIKNNSWSDLPSTPRSEIYSTDGPLTSDIAECVLNRLGQDNLHVDCLSFPGLNGLSIAGTGSVMIDAALTKKIGNDISELIVHELVHECGVLSHAMPATDLEELFWPLWPLDKPNNPDCWRDFYKNSCGVRK